MVPPGRSVARQYVNQCGRGNLARPRGPASACCRPTGGEQRAAWARAPGRGQARSGAGLAWVLPAAQSRAALAVRIETPP